MGGEAVVVAAKEEEDSNDVDLLIAAVLAVPVALRATAADLDDVLTSSLASGLMMLDCMERWNLLQDSVKHVTSLCICYNCCNTYPPPLSRCNRP